MIRLNDLGIERLLSSEGEPPGLFGPLFRCVLGDEDYKGLIIEIEKKLKTRGQREITYFQEDLRKIEMEKNEKEIYEAKKRVAMVESTANIDYSDELKKQGKKAELNDAPSFNGVPFWFFDDHARSYAIIRHHLLQINKKVTIVRFDQHADDGPKGDSMTRNNYMTHLIEDFCVREKIERVITVAGIFPVSISGVRAVNNSLARVYSLKGIEHHLMNLDDLPVITSPVILDSDMDGHEDDSNTRSIWHNGGYWMNYSTNWGLNYYNQQCIVLHPRVAAEKLRRQLRDVREILVATERGYRNRLFHHRIEFDFLEALVE